MDPVPESGRVWAALSELHPRTGLVPIQLDGADFVRPEDPRERTDWMPAWLAAEWRREGELACAGSGGAPVPSAPWPAKTARPVMAGGCLPRGSGVLFL